MALFVIGMLAALFIWLVVLPGCLRIVRWARERPEGAKAPFPPEVPLPLVEPSPKERPARRMPQTRRSRVKHKLPPRPATRAADRGNGQPGRKRPTVAPPEPRIVDTAPVRPAARRKIPSAGPATQPAKRRVLPDQRQREVDPGRGTAEWATIDQAYSGIFKLTELALLPHSLSVPQLYLLGILKNRGGITTTGEIAEAMIKASQTITGLVDRLEQRGLVERVFDRSDRRKTLVRLTGSGERKLEEALPAATRLTEELSSVLTDQELQDLRLKLEKLRRAAMNRLGSAMERL